MAAALLRDAQGFEGNGYDDDMGDEFFSADDPIKRAGISNLLVQLTVANLASIDVNLFSQEHLDNAALPTNIASPVLADYKRLVRYLQANPSQVVSLLIQSSETTTSGAPLLASMTITPTRTTPFGASFSNQILVQAYQSTQDFQVTRATIPMKAGLDAFSFLRIQTGANASGGTVTFNVTVLVGKRAEIRRQVKGGTAVVMRPGGRGPAPVK